ncbi:MAG TPA: ATP-binding cassette domain-containing protein [Actinomycetota bacterium]|nr:ATP-binding cassette domain-containing protein [Actinomycetota bacterium]
MTTTLNEPVVRVEGLQKRFGPTWALRGIDLTIQRGTIYGLLGPNGAGKTTTVRILATLLRPDGGVARVGGFDVTRQPERVRPLIGLTGQYAAVDEELTGYENLVLIARLLELPRRQARRRAGELLERFDLVDAGGRSLRTYSGGMRRRLDVAASLIGRPRVLFLDEPTTGLDPRSRGDVWDLVRSLVADGTTVLLTTQYLDEADRLTAEIAVVDHGLVIEHGTAAALKAKVGGQTLDVRPADRARLDEAAAIVAEVAGATPTRAGDGGLVSASLRGGLAGSRALTAVAQRLDAAGIAVTEAGLRLASLDEVFLALTGRRPQRTQEERR